jgi:alkylation response protein AidB-like acyl-CoA dehydrogenase
VLEGLKLTRLPEADETLRLSVRKLAEAALKNVSADQRARSWMAFDAEFSRALGAAGFIGLTLPREYGGGARGPFARFVVVEELLAVGAPVAAHWIADRQSAPLILRYGTEEQRRFYLPRICRGEIYFCIGMSEAGAGSDLAGVRTRAVRTDRGWQLQGTKLWTTSADHDQYMIALVRTSGAPEDRHAGLSQLIVDLSLPGVSVRPIREISGDAHFCEVHFNEVDLTADALVGEEGAGWQQVTAELAYERSGPERIYSSVVLLDSWIQHLKEHRRCDRASVELVGRLTAQLATLRALAIAVTGKLAQGESPVLEASLLKDLGTSVEQSIPTLIADDLGGRPNEAPSPELYRTLLYTSQIAPTFSLRGGTREILRGIIARGLGLR